MFNHAHISERLKSHASILRGFPINNHIISAYPHAAMYYRVTKTAAMVKIYDRTERNILINPVNLLYRLPDADDGYQENIMGCCLLGFCSGDELNSNSRDKSVRDSGRGGGGGPDVVTPIMLHGGPEVKSGNST